MERPKVGVGVCILKGGKILFGKRKNAHGNGTWSFPGGHLEANESFEDCAKREVLEEAGIKIKNVRFATTTNDIFQKENKHYITIYVVADYDSGQLENKEPEKLEKWAWCQWNDLPQPLFLCVQNLLQTGFNPIKNVFQHYKGNKYHLIGEALHSETKQPLMVYKALYHNEISSLWVRPKEMFHQEIESNGTKVPRFKKIQKNKEEN